MGEPTEEELRDAKDVIEKSLMKESKEDLIFMLMTAYDLYVPPNVVIETAEEIGRKNGGARKSKKVRRRTLKKTRR